MEQKIQAVLYREMAEALVASYRDNIALKSRLLEEKENAWLYTYDDGIYLLSNGAHSQDTERVQTSNISKPTENAVMNAGALVSRLNRDILEEIEDSIRDVDDNLEPVDVGLELLEGDAAAVMEQVYQKGVPLMEVSGENGLPITRYQFRKYKEMLIDAVAEVLEDREIIRRKEKVV